MKLGKSITIITTGMLFAAVIAGHGSMGAAAAESTTADYAVSIALSDAGLSEDEVTIEETEKGSVQGASVYEIAFWTDSKEYEYDIAVADGEIVKVSWEYFEPSADGKQISQAQAKFEDDTAEYKYDIAKQGGEILSCARTILTPACTRAAAEKAAGAESQ